MSIAIAIYVTGAVAWFGGMAMEAEVNLVNDSDPNPFNHARYRVIVMVASGALWPVMAIRLIPSTWYYWMTQTRKAKT